MDRLWTKEFVLMTVGMLFLFTGFYLLLPTLPLFITQLGGSESQVGLAAGVFTLAAVVFRPIVGGLLDRYGRRLFIVWGLLFFALFTYLYDWVSGFATLIALRIIHGVSWAFSTTSVGTAVTDVIPASRRGEGMGWYGMAMTVAMAIGPLVGSWILEQYSFHHLFLLATVLSVIALFLAAMPTTPFQPKPAGGTIALVEKSVLPVMAAVFFLTISYGGVVTFLPLFAESLDVNSGTFFLVYAASLALVRPVAGKLSDRFGEGTVIVPALMVTMAALLVLSLSGGLAGVVLSAVLYGIGFGSAQPALQAASLRLARPDRRGIANASFFTAFDLGIGLGSILLGWISQAAGYPVVFAASAGSIAVSIFIFTVFIRRLLKHAASRAQ